MVTPYSSLSKLADFLPFNFSLLFFLLQDFEVKVIISGTCHHPSNLTIFLDSGVLRFVCLQTTGTSADTPTISHDGYSATVNQSQAKKPTTRCYGWHCIRVYTSAKTLHNISSEFTIIVDKITKSQDIGDIEIPLLIDLKKAFDTIDHRILLRKLYSYGIRGSMLKWMESYLTDRSQYVVFDGKVSETRGIKCGVPQGSILGPLLFII